MASTGLHANYPGALVIPMESDILFGRGNSLSHHGGNAKLHSCVVQLRSRYEKAGRMEKTALLHKIYENLSESSRFVRFDRESQTCYLVGEVAAKEKIGHAIRYVISKTKHRRAKKIKKSSQSSSRKDNCALMDDAELESVLGAVGQYDVPDVSSVHSWDLE